MKKLLILMVFLLFGCQEKEVVIYTSVDQNIAEVVLDGFEKETGIHVKAVYDIEASKTTGIANRLVSEKDHPIADVFWNSEIMMTIHLKNQGVLQAYDFQVDSENKYMDPDSYYVGFGGRARIILINTESSSKRPDSILDFQSSQNKAIANPLFGTTRTHSLILYDLYGEEYLEQIFLSDETEIVDGNSVVRDLVANGQVSYGLTDTDDAHGAIEKGYPVQIVYPDQEGMGTLVIPNTVALVKGHQNTQEAEELMAYILSDQVKKQLEELGFLSDFSDIKVLECDFENAFNQQEAFNAFIRSLLLE